MKKTLTALLFLMVLSSSGHFVSAKEKTATYQFSASIRFTKPSTPLSYSSWNSFWNAFRTAVLRRDRTALKNVMTNPFDSTLLVFASVMNGQAVPSAVKKEVISLLKKHDTFCTSENVTISVESVKVGPRKSGYIGSCKYGGGPSVLFEKTANGLRKLLAVDTGMNGYLYPGKGVSKGYYDMSHSERSGEEVYVTTYRWNGSTYVAQKEKRVR